MSNAVLKGHASGTGTVTLETPNTNSDRTISLPDAAGTVMVSGNMPAFSYYANSTQSVSNVTHTKITFSASDFDTTSGMFATSRFTPTVASYYQINGILRGATTTTMTGLIITLYKNSSAYARGQDGTGAIAQAQVTGSWLVYCNGTTDYIELYGYVDSIGTPSFSYNSVPITSRFMGSLVRAA